MKKVGQIIKKNKMFLIGILIGGMIFGGGVYASSVASSSVSYSNSSSGLNSRNVQGAIDELYQKAKNTGVDSSSIDFTTLKTNTKKTVLASSAGVCIKRNNKLNCFKINNWAVEKEHIQQVFSDISCEVNSSYVSCNGSDFRCIVYSEGSVYCFDESDDSYCSVDVEWGYGVDCG